jgi:hypothetical protein
MSDSRGLIFKLLLAAGALLAVTLLAQTLINYQYVSENLIRQEARRTAQERVRGLELSARLARPEDAAGYQAVLDDFREDFADQIASILLLRADGTTVASSGVTVQPFTTEARRRFTAQRDPELTIGEVDGRATFSGVFLCRCSLPAAAAAPAPPAGRLFVQMTIYRDSLSAPFARLRRNAIVSAAAAVALLVALTLIAVRFGSYVRGKQLEGQLEIARQVQRALLPAAGAWPAGVDAAGLCDPASQVGGDFFDVHERADGCVAFSLGDVSGHGMPAALLMSMLHGAIHGSSSASPDESPDRTAARLNALLAAKSTGERFASMIACVFDPASGTLRYANAGHPPGLLLERQSGLERVARLAEGGPVLGVLPDAAYQASTVETAPGDLLVLFSDGIVEAMNRQDEYFGEGRVLDLIERHRTEPARALCERLLAAVTSFAESRPAADDRTILVVRLWRRDPPRAARLPIAATRG